MEKAVPEFLQYGAMGVMALGFVTLLILFVRADKRSETYCRAAGEAAFDRTQLIRVIVRNTEASTALTLQIASQVVSTEKATAVSARLDERLVSGRCPLLAGETGHHDEHVHGRTAGS